MKNILIIIGLCLSFYSQNYMASTTQPTESECSEVLKTGDEELIARSGCCSWHGGTCGCGSNGKVICCDNTYSPSCTCRGGFQS